MSGRVEETTRPTALAMANGINFSIRISARQKRELIQKLKKQKPYLSKATIHVLVFSTLLFLLLKDHIEKLEVAIVDPEYEGHEASIKTRVLTLLRRQGLKVDKSQLAFQRVTKKSPSHSLAYRVFKRMSPADKVVTAEDVLRQF